MFSKVLIANRGEIACRIISTLKKLGIKSVAVYSEPDLRAKHVRMADEAYSLGGFKSQESYLDINKIINIAKKYKIDAIHPGYGFLSENYLFVEACEKNNIKFIGPKVEAIKIMGQKLESKNLLVKHNIPVIPGYSGDNQEEEFLLKQAKEIGFPVLIKASSGGGGKGMRLCVNQNDFIKDLQAAKREAKASFNDDIVILEKYISKPRHIEVQILFDNHKNGIYLFERDCSIQRRHQKIIEEAPFELFTDELRTKIGNTAIDIGKAVDYRNAGTVEFLLDSENNFYFMEMNTRLQVEHPITEMITGVDLVELQLEVANNKKLAIKQEDLKIKGHAIEARLYAEDVNNNFMPAIGKIDFLKLPNNNDRDIRIDSGIELNDDISMYYDPMLAKIIAYGNNRNQATKKMQQALNSINILGVKNNIEFLKSIIANKNFIQNKIDTSFVDSEIDNLINKDKKFDINTQIALFLAVYYEYLIKYKNKNLCYWESLGRFRLNYTDPFIFNFKYDDKEYLIYLNDHKNVLTFENKEYILDLIDFDTQNITIQIDKTLYKAVIAHHDLSVCVFYDGIQYVFEYLSDKALEQDIKELSNSVISPMPGTITSVKVKKGSEIKEGADLLTLEAMKIEHTIKAVKPGVISEVFYKEGDIVAEGDELLVMD